MYAVVVSGGKQFKVCEGDVIEVEKIEKNVGDIVEFPVLMVVDNEKVTVGAEVSVKATAKVVGHGLGKKIIVFKYKAKKNIRKKKGHRQPFTRVLIEKIN